MRIRLGNKTARTEKGVIQGMLTSPYLFNLYMKDLATRSIERGMKIIFFADDILAVARNKKEME